jgi:hypothetical protein
VNLSGDEIRQLPFCCAEELRATQARQAARPATVVGESGPPLGAPVVSCAPVAATIAKGTRNYEAESMGSTPDHRSSAPYLDTAMHLPPCQKVAESAVLDFAAWLSQSHW